MNIQKYFFSVWRLFAIFVFFHGLSAIGHIWVNGWLVEMVGFVSLLLFTLFVTLKRLEYGMLIAFGELFVGSFGQLFTFSVGEVVLPIRIALFISIMSVWLFRVTQRQSIGIYRTSWVVPYFLLGVVILLTIGRGLLNGNYFSDIFFDANSFLFFLYILPLFDPDHPLDFLKRVQKVFIAAFIWVAFESLGLSYIFSHGIEEWSIPLYHWIRDTRLGEITSAGAGFYRIFFQSQIYIVLALLIIFSYTAAYWHTIFGKQRWRIGIFFGMSIATLLISFSRSFWLGILIGLCAFFAVAVLQKSGYQVWKNILQGGGVGILLGLFFFVSFIFFPFPAPKISDLSFLNERAFSLAGEPGATSRWNLLVPLWYAVKEQWVYGAGFGATVTYVSTDPRVRETYPTGEYTTFAFEWGWLDLLLKMGSMGVGIFVYLLAILMKKIWVSKAWWRTGMLCSMVVLMGIHFFTPYLNHPLGIGWILLVTLFVQYPAAFQEVVQIKKNTVKM